MRIFKAFLTVLILVSCDKEVKNFKPQSSGRINSISVIIDKPSWDGKIGDAIRDKYASEFIGLPQVEEAFTLNYIPYEAFTGFGRTARNVIYINKKKQDKPRMIRDRYARPQLFLEVSGLDNESIIPRNIKLIRVLIGPISKRRNYRKQKQNSQLSLKRYWP